MYLNLPICLKHLPTEEVKGGEARFYVDSVQQYNNKGFVYKHHASIKSTG